MGDPKQSSVDHTLGCLLVGCKGMIEVCFLDHLFLVFGSKYCVPCDKESLQYLSTMAGPSSLKYRNLQEPLHFYNQMQRQLYRTEAVIVHASINATKNISSSVA